MKANWIKEFGESVQAMERLGWRWTHTGGGCTAMRHRNGRYEILVTDSGWSDVPKKDEPCAIGLYEYLANEYGEYQTATGDIQEGIIWTELVSKTPAEWMQLLKARAGV